MSWWITVPLFFIAWFFFTVIPAVTEAIEHERQGVPEPQRHGVSIAPVFPLLPAIAWLIWGFGPPLAAAVIFWLHVALLAISLLLIIYFSIKLHRTQARRMESSENDRPHTA